MSDEDEETEYEAPGQDEEAPAPRSKRKTPRRGPFDGGDRIAQIARWLRKEPELEEITELVLFCRSGDGAEHVVRRYPRVRVNPTLAIELSELIEDYAQAVEAHCVARLSWCTDEGRELQSKPFKARYQSPGGEKFPVEGWDGGASSMLTQSQRHIEVVIRQNTQLVQAVQDGVKSRDEQFDRLLQLTNTLLERTTIERESERERAIDSEKIAERATQVAEEALERAEKAVAAAEERVKSDRTDKLVEAGLKLLTGGKLGGEESA